MPETQMIMESELSDNVITDQYGVPTGTQTLSSLPKWQN